MLCHDMSMHGLVIFNLNYRFYSLSPTIASAMVESLFVTPSECTGGRQKMNFDLSRARQPHWEPWPLSWLVHEQAVALSYALDSSMQQNYDSACTSYLTFVHAHGLPVNPTSETLSFYVVYMSHHISPRSVQTYLSGIVSQLEPFFPSVCEACSSRLVQRTLKGCL